MSTISRSSVRYITGKRSSLKFMRSLPSVIVIGIVETVSYNTSDMRHCYRTRFHPSPKRSQAMPPRKRLLQNSRQDLPQPQPSPKEPPKQKQKLRACHTTPTPHTSDAHIHGRGTTASGCPRNAAASSIAESDRSQILPLRLVPTRSVIFLPLRLSLSLMRS